MPSQGIVWSALPWKDIIPRVALYAHNLLRRRPFAGVQASADDLVLSAIEKTISGDRQWKVEEVGIIEHLMGVVSSDLYNSVRKYSSHKNIYELENIKSDDDSPEDTALINLEIRNILRFLMDKDEKLFDVAYLHLVMGVDRTSELAQTMKVSERTARNLNIRLKSSIEEYYNQGDAKGDKQKEKQNDKTTA